MSKYKLPIIAGKDIFGRRGLELHVALGIFLILSARRPDWTIIDGDLKDNLTVKYAFRQANKRNSRIILGDGHKEDASAISEQEKGRFYMCNDSINKYMQSPFLDVYKARTMMETLKKKNDRGDAAAQNIRLLEGASYL